MSHLLSINLSVKNSQVSNFLYFGFSILNSLNLPYHNNNSMMPIANQMNNMNLANNLSSNVIQGNRLNNIACQSQFYQIQGRGRGDPDSFNCGNGFIGG